MLWCTACRSARIAAEGADLIAGKADYQESYRKRAKGARFSGPIEMILRAMHEGRAEWVLANRKKPDRALDIGCGRGDLAIALSKRGWEVDGVELNEGLKAVDAPPGVRLMVGDFMELPLAKPYGLVCLFHVLEHLTDLDAAITRIEDITAPDADLVIEVPNANSLMHRLFGEAWLGRDLPNHVHQFCPQPLATYLKKRGWKLIRVRQWSLEFGPFSTGQTLANAALPRFHNAFYSFLQNPSPSLRERLAALAQFPFILFGSIAYPLLHLLTAPAFSGEIIRMHLRKSNEESR